MKIHKNDTVLIVAGKDRGKKGKVRKAIPDKDTVIVEGLNMIKRHSKTKGQTRQAGIIELEGPIHISNVMVICNKCSKPARLGYRILEDGKKARYCHNCSEIID
ncbi:MAG: 50S ribosomal protein L24 [Dehalococcoidia bacterium]|nr:50S ribosomal protein L24 [Dehalococcoidia bacterium]